MNKEMEVRKKNKMSTSVIVKAGFLAAISIVLTRYVSVMVPVGGIQGIRIGFGRIPLMMSGILFGPIVGGITGFAADTIGVMLNPMGQFHPGFSLSAILDGLLPGLIFLYFKSKPLENGGYISKFRVFVPALTMTIVNSLVLNTLWLSMLGGKSVFVLLPLRALNAFVNLPIQVFVIYVLLKNVRE